MWAYPAAARTPRPSTAPGHLPAFRSGVPAGQYIGFCRAICGVLQGGAARTHGHIAIGTPDVERAEFHLGLQGTEFLEHTRKVDDKGRTKAIYLNQTFAGFAVHLMRK